MQPRQSRLSRQVMNAFTTNKFQNIRKANEMKREYYPDTQKNQIKEEDESANVEVHLLHRKFEQQLAKKTDPADRQAASKNYSKIR